MLNEVQLTLIDSGACPDCLHRGFRLGPRGGNAISIECGNLDCRARFNVSSASWSHHLALGHRTPKESEGGSNWDLA